MIIIQNQINNVKRKVFQVNQNLIHKQLREKENLAVEQDLIQVNILIKKIKIKRVIQQVVRA